MPEKIGFVGVGRMGSNMARRLKDCGYEISAIFDSSQALAQEVANELGARAVDTLAEVTAQSDVVFTVISNDDAMKSIFTDGLLTNATGKLFINCATLSPDIHVWAEEQAQRHGALALEASMASSIPRRGREHCT